MPIHDADYERDEADFVADSLSHAGIWTDEDEQACSGGRLASGQDASDTRPSLSEGGDQR